MKRVTYVGPFVEGVSIDTGQTAMPNETIEVPDELAGRPPKGEPGRKGYDPGEGLLAQTGNWAEAKPKKEG